MSQKKQLILVAILSALLGAIGVYFWQTSTYTQKQIQFKKIISLTEGAAKFNCELSGGTVENGACKCQIEEEISQTQEMMYDKETGFCQSTHGGPAGDAFEASIGLPYGSYSYFTGIVLGLCEKSGGGVSGAACICPSKTIYDKSTGYCK